MEFMEEYLELTQGAKIELLDGRLVISDSPNHTKRLLHQILRGWGLEAAIVLAPEALRLEAFTLAPPLIPLLHPIIQQLLKFSRCHDRD